MKKLILVMTLLFSLQALALESDANNNAEQEYQALVDLFFSAARIGDSTVLKTFLDNGFPIDQRNNQSYTALMVAAYNGQKSAVHLLLNAGANACLQDKRGNTAIMGALLKVEVAIAKELYQAKCSPQTRNKAGLTLSEFAQMFGQSEVLKSLELNAK